jgi:hypothetical protein
MPSGNLQNSRSIPGADLIEAGWTVRRCDEYAIVNFLKDIDRQLLILKYRFC